MCFSVWHINKLGIQNEKCKVKAGYFLTLYFSFCIQPFAGWRFANAQMRQNVCFDRL